MIADLCDGLCCPHCQEPDQLQRNKVLVSDPVFQARNVNGGLSEIVRLSSITPKKQEARLIVGEQGSLPEVGIYFSCRACLATALLRVVTAAHGILIEFAVHEPENT